MYRKRFKTLNFGAILGPNDQNFLLKNKFRKLRTLQFLSLDNEETCRFYTKFLSHLIKNGALKWLQYMKFDGRSISSLLKDVHIELFKNNFYKRKREGDFVIYEKQKIEKYDT